MTHYMPWSDMPDEQEDVVEMWDEIKAETENAYLFGDENCSANVWLPKSQVKVNKMSRGYEVQIPYWLAKKKGLV